MIKTRNGAEESRSYGRVNSMQVHKREVVEQVVFQVLFKGFLARDSPQVTQKNVSAEWNKVREAFFCLYSKGAGQNWEESSSVSSGETAHHMKA